MSKPGSQERLQSNRARRQIEVAPPTFIFMTDQQSDAMKERGLRSS
jgi:hypothetical protein